MTEQPTGTPPDPIVKYVGLKPPGVLPRNVQTWVIAGISLLMVLIIAVSGGKPTKTSQTTAVVPPAPTDPSETRIREYRTSIEEQARRLQTEQVELDRAKSNFALGAGLPPNRTTAADLGAAMSPEPRERHWIEVEVEKREFEARFASNIALSHRDDKPVLSAAAKSMGPETNTPSEPSKPDSGSRATVENGLHRLLEGTVMETTLTNRLDGTFSGPVNCMVTADVYAANRMTLLIPAGSRVLGEAQRVEAFGQKRLAVAFHRLILPNGSSVSLDQFKGLNQVGETGLKDQVNNHYLQIFGVSAAIGAIAGLGQATTRYGANQTGTDVYVQGVASSMSQSSLRILDHFLNVLPTLTIREGQRVKVYLSNDLLLPAYEKHPVPRNL